MLPSNGRIVKVRNNYHMTVEEFKVLLKFLKKRYDSKFYLAVMIQFVMGLRASELLAIQIWDFKNDFNTLKFRQAKTNNIIEDPVPGPLKDLIIRYIATNKHRLVDGYLFPKHTGKERTITTRCYIALWSKWRKGIAKEYNDPSWLDKYEFKTLEGKIILRYRISSHSLRRLHRTTLIKTYPKDPYLVKELCNYQDFSAFQKYINEFEMHDKKESLLLPLFTGLSNDFIFASSGQRQLKEFE